jgi:hypothetical protein
MREGVLDNRVRTAYCLVEERPQLVGLSSRADWNSQS